MLPFYLSQRQRVVFPRQKQKDRQAAGSSFHLSSLAISLFLFFFNCFPLSLNCLVSLSFFLKCSNPPLPSALQNQLCRLCCQNPPPPPLSLSLSLSKVSAKKKDIKEPVQVSAKSLFTNLLFTSATHAPHQTKASLPPQLLNQRAYPHHSHSLTMDFHLKQWKNHHHSESEDQHFAKMPRLMLESHLHSSSSPSSPALPLFVPELNSKVSSLSSFSDSSSSPPPRFPRMGSYFSVAQWQELELQALIFRYMLAGAAVPPELLLPIKKSLLHSAYFLHYQPSLLQSGYWGGAPMDPEPGRCRRTDGKKWRCSRDVVAGQKYCERHMHRGRNRSRKPVEVPTPATAGGVGSATAGTGVGCPSATTASVSAPHMAPTALRSPFDLLQLNRCSSGTIKNEKESVFENQSRDNVDGAGRSDGHILRHFFDDWPRSLQEPDNAESNASSINSATCLSISMPGKAASSDVSLKLSTGDDAEDPYPRSGNVGPQNLRSNWAGGWASSANHVASMGGPLAEALRSSTTTSSPTSVLHQLPRGSASETSFIST